MDFATRSRKAYLHKVSYHPLTDRIDEKFGLCAEGLGQLLPSLQVGVE